MIQTYFVEIKAALDQYSKSNFVLESTINFETRPGNQGYVHGSLLFIDGSRFFFREYLDATGDQVDKLMYTYHYQDVADKLMFRYDNSQHRPSLPFADHKHVGNFEIIQADRPALISVLVEIAEQQGWI